MNKDDRIFIAGHRGLVGSAVVRNLQSRGYTNLLFKSRQELDLSDQIAVEKFFKLNRPRYVILAAARVGGIMANMSYPSEFLYENLQIQNNVIWSSFKYDVEKLLFLGSSCIYPKDSPQPMTEENFLSGKPEPTNEAYAIAKIAGMKLCEYIYREHNRIFISCMPTNIYGEGDNFNPESSHVIPALMRRIHEAKISKAPEVSIWGSGNTKREFMHADDLADAIYWMMTEYEDVDFLNVGTGEDISVKELAMLIRKVVGYKGKLVYDTSKPDGMPRKLLDVSKLHSHGWRHKIKFDEGLLQTYQWYLEQPSTLKSAKG